MKVIVYVKDVMAEFYGADPAVQESAYHAAARGGKGAGLAALQVRICPDCKGMGCYPDKTACTSCLGTGQLPDLDAMSYGAVAPCECVETVGTVLCDGCKFEICRACGFPCACVAPA